MQPDSKAVKPPLPADRTLARLHFLLYTPFRHPPLPHGSRFGTRAERGIWYGSLTLPTAFAEVAYYRLVFLDGTAVELGTVTVELSAFQAAVCTRRGVDLTARGPRRAYLLEDQLRELAAARTRHARERRRCRPVRLGPRP